ncbi:MAG: hypothetical protein ACTSPQ_09420 [Candidatus Helarchaeota archaeon]
MIIKKKWYGEDKEYITTEKYLRLSKKEKKEFDNGMKLLSLPVYTLYFYYMFIQLGVEELQGYPWLGLFMENGHWVVYLAFLIITLTLNIMGFRVIRNKYFRDHPNLKDYYKENKFKIRFPPHIFLLTPIIFLDYYPRNWIELIIWVSAIYFIFIGPRPGKFYYWEKALYLARAHAEKTKLAAIYYLDGGGHAIFLASVILFPSLTLQVFNIYPIISIFLLPIGEKITDYVYVKKLKEHLKRYNRTLCIQIIIFIITFMIPAWCVIDAFVTF